MAWSKYQNDIFDYALNNSGSFSIKAVAGSGKTTTLVECAKRISSSNQKLKILFLAFNKMIVDKLKEETAGMNINCKTLHGFGMAALCKSGLKFKLNEKKWATYINKKVFTLLGAEYHPLGKKDILPYKLNCLKLFDMCRINLVKSGDFERIQEIAGIYGIIGIANEVQAVSKMLKLSTNLVMFKLKEGFEIDYIDMITLPLTDTYRQFVYKYDVVFIDEAQDLSLAQQELMQLAVAPNGKFISAGDPAQSITAFAGTLMNSYDRLAKLAGKELPLSVNYRCGRTIVELAQNIVPEITPCDFAEDGQIVHQKDLKNAQYGDMVICRKTAPLIELVLKYMIDGNKTAFVKGNDIAEDIRNLINKVGGDDNSFGLQSLYDKLDDYKVKIYDKLMKGDVTSIQSFHNIVDKIHCIHLIGDRCFSVSDIFAMIDKIFADRENGDAIVMSTIHKAKGLEADNVFIVCPELLPFVYDKQQQWEFEQEMNLKYVAITRAKKNLYFVDVEESKVSEIEIN